MSIDGRIGRVHWTAADLRIEILPRLESDGHTWSCPGQDSLLILACTWEPPFGLAIWGNSGQVFIEAHPQRRYERVSYGELREAHPTPKE